MTPDQMAAAKARAFALFGVAIAAFVGSYVVESDIAQFIFVIIAIGCLLVAGRIAIKLKKEEAK